MKEKLSLQEIIGGKLRCADKFYELRRPSSCARHYCRSPSLISGHGNARDRQKVLQHGHNRYTVSLYTKIFSHFPATYNPKLGSCLKTGQHSIFVIKRKIKKIMHVCWIPYLLMILMTLWSNVFHY